MIIYIHFYVGSLFSLCFPESGLVMNSFNNSLFIVGFLKLKYRFFFKRLFAMKGFLKV